MKYKYIETRKTPWDYNFPELRLDASKLRQYQINYIFKSIEKKYSKTSFTTALVKSDKPKRTFNDNF